MIEQQEMTEELADILNWLYSDIDELIDMEYESEAKV